MLKVGVGYVWGISERKELKGVCSQSRVLHSKSLCHRLMKAVCGHACVCVCVCVSKSGNMHEYYTFYEYSYTPFYMLYLSIIIVCICTIEIVAVVDSK